MKKREKEKGRKKIKKDEKENKNGGKVKRGFYGGKIGHSWFFTRERETRER